MKRAWGRTAMTLVMANCVFGLAGCGGSGEAAVTGAPVPPPAPTPVPPPAPTPVPPPPAPAPSPPPPTTYSAAVSWSVPLLNTDGSPLTDVSGYRVYYGTSPTNLAQSIPVSGAGVTSYVVTGLAAGTYYFAVATINSTGMASAVSNAASRSVP